MESLQRSVYKRGAEDGLVLGPLLVAVVVLTGATTYRPWLFLPTLLLMAAVPVFVYRFLRRSHAEQPLAGVSALWLEGICAFFFGGLIMSLAAYLCMRWFFPTFIADQFLTVIDVYSRLDSPDARDVAATLQKAVDARALPTPIEMALELLYLAVLSGSLLSGLMALIIKRGRRKSPPTPPPFQ